MTCNFRVHQSEVGNPEVGHPNRAKTQFRREQGIKTTKNPQQNTVSTLPKPCLGSRAAPRSAPSSLLQFSVGGTCRCDVRTRIASLPRPGSAVANMPMLEAYAIGIRASSGSALLDSLMPPKSVSTSFETSWPSFTSASSSGILMDKAACTFWCLPATRTPLTCPKTRYARTSNPFAQRPRWEYFAARGLIGPCKDGLFFGRGGLFAFWTGLGVL